MAVRKVESVGPVGPVDAVGAATLSGSLEGGDGRTGEDVRLRSMAVVLIGNVIVKRLDFRAVSAADMDRP